MRKNARWSGMTVSGLNMGDLGQRMGLRTPRFTKENHPQNEVIWIQYKLKEQKLFTKLYSSYVRDMDTLTLVTPFLDVVRSGNTTGSIAGTALGSIEKFLHYGIIGLQSPNIGTAMNALAKAATRCKFEASDAASDELVLLRMLQLLQMILTSECGQVLSDEAVCEMMETGLSMCCQMRLSEMLRRSAEHVMINIIVAMFERLKVLEDEWQFVDLQSETNDDEKEVSSNAPHMKTPRPTLSPVSKSEDDEKVKEESGTESSDTEQILSEKTEENESSTETPQDTPTTTATATVEVAYGLPSIRELLRVLISLLNPHEHTHTDSMRMMALSILNVAFEVGGRSISRFETLRSLVMDDFCKYLFQLAKTNSIQLLASTLRVISTVFDTMRPHLKLQHELFLFFLIERLSPPPGAGTRTIVADVDDDGNVGFIPVSREHSLETRGPGHVEIRSASPNMFLGRTNDYPKPAKGYQPDAMAISGEVRELLLECLVQCSRTSTFLIDIWYNYDCDISCGDLFEELIQFLSKNSFPDLQNYSLTSFHVNCFDTLLSFIKQMVKRSEDEDLVPVDELLRRKARKKIILNGAALFNESPKKGIQYLTENGIIEADKENDTKESLAYFLRSTQQLNKKSLGEYLGKPENFELLQVFMRQFDFKGKRMDEALRIVLETFRLPGESQQIMRVADTFADVFFEQKPSEIADSLAAQILAYSIIMLNTDQHNPQVRGRMTLQDYMRNVRGVNAGQDFSKEYLVYIYEAIRQDEIVMPEEHEGRLGFNYAWKQLLHRANSAAPFTSCDTPAYDKAMFEQTWKPIVASISYAFSTAQDDTTLEKAIEGFYHCSLLASKFGLHNVVDSIISNLAMMSGLLTKANSDSSLPDPIVEVAGQKYVISRLAVRLGHNYRNQLAAVTMFTIINKHSNSLRSSWTKVLQIIRNLFVNSMLPDSMIHFEDFLAGSISIPLKPKSPVPSKQNNRRDGSLLSTLSSYLLSPYSNDESYRADPTEEEIECAMSAVICVSAFNLEKILADISVLETEPLICFMKAIGTVGYDSKSIESTTTTIPYDPTTILFLQFMVTIADRNINRIDILW
ncbi:hypothetical protein J3Q64DRAFT_1649624 [Phycomyces blakesleeanus]|uniref:SEC7 domain-containing protein n=1 Tax=Phycomyces blakesleeanus TaxID=4837 RepID=A0ABR3AK49_PHYBL